MVMRSQAFSPKLPVSYYFSSSSHWNVVNEIYMLCLTSKSGFQWHLSSLFSTTFDRLIVYLYFSPKSQSNFPVMLFVLAILSSTIHQITECTNYRNLIIKQQQRCLSKHKLHAGRRNWPWPSNSSEWGTKHVFRVNLAKIRSAVPEIFHTQTKKL